MAKAPQRIVEAAVVERMGVITAHDLLGMSNDSWGILRDRISDRRNGKDGLTAHCMACESQVYVTSVPARQVNRPLFAHYRGGDPECPWYHGKTMKPDHVRAAQYQGKQESNFHRTMCELVAELAKLDKRYLRHTVAEYLAPTENSHGRYPDAYIEWEGFGPFAVEFQMSGTFQTEISARCKHYEYEGIPLLWVLFGIETHSKLSQSFIDVIRRHRGNAFVLDRSAVAASREQRTLVLSCYLNNGTNFDEPELVRFDELNIPRSKLPFHEDRIVKPKLLEIEQRRAPWFKALASWDHWAPILGYDRPITLLVAAAFSIVAAANGKERNYASGHQNIKGMLNTYLHGGTFAEYADLLKKLIENTASYDLLNTNVGVHLNRHRAAVQVGSETPPWQILKELIPEALDPVLREELIYLDALPDWATGGQ